MVVFFVLKLVQKATCFVLDARRRGGAAITERLHSSGLVQAVVHAFALVDVPPLWEPKILEAYAPRLDVFV